MSNKAPSLWRVNELKAHTETCAANINGKWVPCRAVGLDTIRSRIRLAWMVFTGKADALIWPEGQ